MTTLIPYPEACQRLGGISLVTLWRLVRDKKLIRKSIGRRAFITSDSIDAYLETP